MQNTECSVLQVPPWGVFQWSKLSLINFNISTNNLLYGISPLELHGSGNNQNILDVEVKNSIKKVMQSFGWQTVSKS